MNTGNTSFDLTQLNQNVKKYGADPLNEVIFHNSVPIKYIKEIWADNENIKKQIEKLLDFNNINIPVLIMYDYPSKIYTCDEKIEPKKPNHCYFFDKYERRHYGKPEGYPYDIEWYRTLAKKCNVDSDKYSTAEDLENILEEKQIQTTDKEKIKKFLRSKKISKRIVDNLTDKQLTDISKGNLVGINFLKSYSDFEYGDGKRRTLKL
jgi:hypothetical protein